MKILSAAEILLIQDLLLNRDLLNRDSTVFCLLLRMSLVPLCSGHRFQRHPKSIKCRCPIWRRYNRSQLLFPCLKGSDGQEDMNQSSHYSGSSLSSPMAHCSIHSLPKSEGLARPYF